MRRRGALLLAAALALPVVAAPVAQAQGEGLVLGTALPTTGALAAYGPATQTAVLLAVEDANAAGGVAGAEVTLVRGDSGDSPQAFATTAARLRTAGAQAVVGPLSSALLLDSLASLDGLAFVAPAATSPLLNGRVARTSPSDDLQGMALARLAAQSRVSRLAIVVPRAAIAMARAALSEATLQSMTGEIVAYTPRARAADVAESIARVHADGVILMGGTETTGIIRELLRRGLPATVLLTATAGASIDGAALPRGLLRGARELGPDLRVPQPLADRIRARDRSAKEISYAALAYDAAAVAILAAEQSARFLGEVTPDGIKAAIPSVSAVGTPCTTLASCLRKVRTGVDIDYVGQSGAVDLSAAGDPLVATYAVRTLGPNNEPGPRVRYVTVP